MDLVSEEIKRAIQSIQDIVGMFNEDICSTKVSYADIINIIKRKLKSNVINKESSLGPHREIMKLLRARLDDAKKDKEKKIAEVRKELGGTLDILLFKRDRKIQTVRDEIDLIKVRTDRIIDGYMKSLAVTGRAVQNSCDDYRETNLSRSIRAEMDDDIIAINEAQKKANENISVIVKRVCGDTQEKIERITDELTESIRKIEKTFQIKESSLKNEITLKATYIDSIEHFFGTEESNLYSLLKSTEMECGSKIVPIITIRDRIIWEKRQTLKTQ